MPHHVLGRNYFRNIDETGWRGGVGTVLIGRTRHGVRELERGAELSLNLKTSISILGVWREWSGSQSETSAAEGRSRVDGWVTGECWIAESDDGLEAVKGPLSSWSATLATSCRGLFSCYLRLRRARSDDSRVGPWRRLVRNVLPTPGQHPRAPGDRGARCALALIVNAEGQAGSYTKERASSMTTGPSASDARCCEKYVSQGGNLGQEPGC
ncbi:hypothetical protein K458DRAFT_409697 [Lentithecium fluviatile CBS 122367]|uniref:Uncharacterized protein n=1 Tax=Lentithecium fluviatile CBS 122367 TaxID=1168545 RepID=A0A6G1IGY0_9PLEO|nr:hypothetical protein K458DRAFT_409697 [Lentithecium fluviatile CBS 122367]